MISLIARLRSFCNLSNSLRPYQTGTQQLSKYSSIKALYGNIAVPWQSNGFNLLIKCANTRGDNLTGNPITMFGPREMWGSQWICLLYSIWHSVRKLATRMDNVWNGQYSSTSHRQFLMEGSCLEVTYVAVSLDRCSFFLYRSLYS